MPHIVPISDSTDRRIQNYADLRWNANPGQDDDFFIVEGRLCVERLIRSRHKTLSLLVQRGGETDVASWLDDDTPVYTLPSAQIRQLVGYRFHRGVLACGKRPPLMHVEQLRFSPNLPRVALGILAVNERENLGSMIRTAAALGIERLLIGPCTADPFSRRSIRVSMGAVFKQHLYRLDQPHEDLARLQRTRNARTIVATLDPRAAPLDRFRSDDREMILIVGNEADGVAPEVEAIATDRVSIPMQLGTDSLNVSVAAAIFMYQLLRGGDVSVRSPK